MGRKTGFIFLLLVVGLLAGALIAAILLSPVLCHHYHWSCPGA